MAAIKHLDIFTYDTSRFPFSETIEKILGYPLEKLHEIKQYQLFTREKDQFTIFHRKLYDAFDIHFKEIYLEFLNSMDRKIES